MCMHKLEAYPGQQEALVILSNASKVTKKCSMLQYKTPRVFFKIASWTEVFKKIDKAYSSS